MRNLTTGLLALGLLLLAALPAVQAQGELRATVTLKDASGQTVGSFTLSQGPNDVHLLGNVTGLAPGVHGIHVHAVASCTGPTFDSAGPHFNASNNDHGLESPAGPHNGDLANLVVGENGTGSYDHTTTHLTLDSGRLSVFDHDGSSIVIHAAPDDYKTEPAGNSGARVACGVIVAQQPAPTMPLPDTGVADQPVSLPNTAEPAGGAPTWVLLLGLALLAGALSLRLRSRH